jgi:hypothetical protein
MTAACMLSRSWMRYPISNFKPWPPKSKNFGWGNHISFILVPLLIKDSQLILSTQTLRWTHRNMPEDSNSWLKPLCFLPLLGRYLLFMTFQISLVFQDGSRPDLDDWAAVQFVGTAQWVHSFPQLHVGAIGCFLNCDFLFIWRIPLTNVVSRRGSKGAALFPACSFIYLVGKLYGVGFLLVCLIFVLCTVKNSLVYDRERIWNVVDACPISNSLLLRQFMLRWPIP